LKVANLFDIPHTSLPQSLSQAWCNDNEAGHA